MLVCSVGPRSGSGLFFQSICGALMVGLHDSQSVYGPTVDLKSPD